MRASAIAHRAAGKYTPPMPPFGLPRDLAQWIALALAAAVMALGPRLVRPTAQRRVFLGLAALASASLSAAYVVAYLRGGPRIIDATSYYLEARAVAQGLFAWPVEPPEAAVLGRFLVRAVGPNPDTRSAEGIGRLVAQLHTMRRMSVSVAGMLQAGKEPVVEASIVKDIGTVWEQQLPHRVRDLAAFVEETATNRETLERQLDFAIKTAPKLTIQGGTTEVLRGIIARGLGLR